MCCTERQLKNVFYGCWAPCRTTGKSCRGSSTAFLPCSWMVWLLGGTCACSRCFLKHWFSRHDCVLQGLLCCIKCESQHCKLAHNHT